MAAGEAVDQFEAKHGANEASYTPDVKEEYHSVHQRLVAAKHAMGGSHEEGGSDVSRISNRVSSVGVTETPVAAPGPDVEGKVDEAERQWFDKEISVLRYTSIQVRYTYIYMHIMPLSLPLN